LRLARCVQAANPGPNLTERVIVQAREKLGIQYIGEGDADSKPFAMSDYTWQLGEPFDLGLALPIEASTQPQETATYFNQRGLTAHAFAGWPTVIAS
jgi:hypothetical protein